MYWTFRCSHENSTENRINPTCSEEGAIQYICDDCGEIAKTTPIDPLPHTPDGKWVTVTEPTCFKDGKRTQACTVCGGVAKEETIERLEHNYGDWSVTTKPTCGNSGVETRVCMTCGEKDTQSVDPTGEHNYGPWTITKAPTCTATGTRTHTCTVCGKEEQETVAKTDHDYGDWTTQMAPTCGKEGYEGRKCKNCGKTEERVLAATGNHVFGPWSRENETRALRTCTVCRYTENQYTDPVTNTTTTTQTTTQETTTTTPQETAAIPAAGTAYASTQTVEVDGKKVTFECYALKDENGYDTNYIKLRDLAKHLNGSAAQFEVGWNVDVTITTKVPYTPNGSELSTPFSGNRPYQRTAGATKVNGRAAQLAAFTLTDDAGGGYTYYQLRDLGKTLGFNVGWTAQRGMFVETDKAYDPAN